MQNKENPFDFLIVVLNIVSRIAHSFRNSCLLCAIFRISGKSLGMIFRLIKTRTVDDSTDCLTLKYYQTVSTIWSTITITSASVATGRETTYQHRKLALASAHASSVIVSTTWRPTWSVLRKGMIVTLG